MAKRGRKYREAIEAYDKREARNFEEAITLLKSFPKRGFDESVELSFNLGIDGRQADQTLRGTVMLPHGTGKEVRVVVVTQGVARQIDVQGAGDGVGHHQGR